MGKEKKSIIESFIKILLSVIILTASNPTSAQTKPPPSQPHEIGNELKVTGQSRSFSMGLLFQKEKDKLTFGKPRMNYKDKILSKETNF